MKMLRKFFSSLKHAMRGVRVVFEQEQSFRFQLLAAIVALILTGYYPLSPFEVTVVFLLIGAVLSLEMLNSVFERIVDTFKPRIHPIVKDIKDIMAGTVFILSFTALCIGVVIFGPYLLWSFSSIWLY
jgi:undecaprenol kinase